MKKLLTLAFFLLRAFCLTGGAGFFIPCVYVGFLHHTQVHYVFQNPLHVPVRGKINKLKGTAQSVKLQQSP